MIIPKKTISEKQVKEFLIKELDIPEQLYHRFMKLDTLRDMTEEKYEQLLQKVEQHFSRSLPIPKRHKFYKMPSTIQNGLNQTGKLFREW